MADAAEGVKVPLVSGAVGRFDGSLTVLKPFETDAEGRAIRVTAISFPNRRRPGLVPSCAEAGVLGALTGVDRHA